MNIRISTLFTFLITGFMTMSLNSQIITEIMYNPPESGQDSLEYIEIYNETSEAIQLMGYSFTEGIEHEFTEDRVLAPEEYLVLSVSDTAHMNVFGVESIEWNSGGLNNSGEVITLVNADGTPIISVEYGDRDMWPEEADGNGPSLELCDITESPIDPANWSVSESNTGVIINGNEVLGSPGAANTAECSVSFDEEILASNFAFTPSDITITVGETVQFRNTEGFHNINGNISTFPDNPESFGNGDASSDLWTYTFTFNIEGVYNFQCDPHSAQMNGTITVESATTLMEISDVNDVDSETGIGENLGDLVRVEGIVQSPNINPSGLSFVIQDAEDMEGINIYNGGDDLGYNVELGDIVQVTGRLDQFNGLMQIAAENVSIQSSDNSLVPEQTVTELNEDTENELVIIEDVSIVEPNDWKSSGSFNVEITNGSSNYVMRIDNDAGFEDLQPPSGTFDVKGMGGQFDPEEPYLEGYQILPRFPEDIDPYETEEPEYPEYDIADVIQNDADGVPDSIGVDCTLRGLMVGLNFSFDGYQLVIVNDDNTAGITIFATDVIDGVTPEEGDVVVVEGTISQFNGLTQIQAVSVTIESSGNTIPDPVSVDELSENTENRYVQIQADLESDVQWDGNGENVNKDFTNPNGETQVIRIDKDVPVSNFAYNPMTEGTQVMVTGVGGQFDPESEYFEGYQILPFTEDDIEPATSVLEGSISEGDIKVFPNPVRNSVNIQSKYRINSVEIHDQLGRTLENIELDSENAELNVDKLSSGVFYLIVRTDQGVVSKKIIK